MQTPKTLKNISAQKLAKLLPEECLEELRDEALKKVGFKMSYLQYLKTNDPKSTVTMFLKAHMMISDNDVYVNLPFEDPDGWLGLVNNFLESDVDGAQTLKEAYELYKEFCKSSSLIALQSDSFRDELCKRGFQLAEQYGYHPATDSEVAQDFFIGLRFVSYHESASQ